MSYVDGFVLSVPSHNLDAYKTMASKAGALWKEHGALKYIECMGDDMADKGFCATFPATFKPLEGEVMIFAFIVYKSREHRDEVNQKVMTDPRMNEAGDPNNMPFDVKRMCYGGFQGIVEF